MVVRRPEPDRQFELPDQAPWPHPAACTTTLPLSSVQLWPAGALWRRTAPDALGSPIIIMVDSDDEGDDPENGVPGTHGTNRGVAPGGQERSACALGRQQDTATAPRARSSPTTQAQGPPIQQRCVVRRSFSARDGAARKCKPSGDQITIAGPGTGHGHLVPAPEGPPKVRKANK